MTGIKWSGDLVGNLQQMDAKNKAAMRAAAAITATSVESFMKNNAPWQDQTGAARNGLGAEVQGGGNKIAIVIYHSVPYGVYLETRWGGKYQILRPGLQHGAKLFGETLKGMIFR